MVMEYEQKAFIEFKGLAALRHQLPGAVQELRKDGRHLARIRLYVAAAFAELVPKRQPVLLDERLKALNCAIVRIQHELRQRTHLSSAIPAIRAVYNHGDALVDGVGNEAAKEN